MRTALCSSGQRLAVEFERTQPESKDSTGRQSSYNFANSAGAVFRVLGASANPGASCLVSDEAFLAGTTVIPLTRPPQDARCSKAQYPAIPGQQIAARRSLLANRRVARGCAGCDRRVRAPPVRRARQPRRHRMAIGVSLSTIRPASTAPAPTCGVRMTAARSTPKGSRWCVY